jgi:hypothetical protein
MSVIGLGLIDFRIVIVWLRSTCPRNLDEEIV